MRKVLLFSISFLIMLLVTGCKKTDTKQDNTVFVSILPQKYFVEKIAGDRLKVEVLVTPGKSPETYEPTPQQVISLGNAKALFTIGVPFENAFLPKIQATIKSLKIVDTSFGIKKRILEKETKAPHIWLSPSLVKIQAENIYNALIEIDPDGKSNYTKGYQCILDELLNGYQ